MRSRQTCACVPRMLQTMCMSPPLQEGTDRDLLETIRQLKYNADIAAVLRFYHM